MTIAAEAQLALPVVETLPRSCEWAGLPEPARAAVLVLLARLIARGVLSTASPDTEDTPSGPGVGEEASHG
jgi:hypothetical protein